MHRRVSPALVVAAVAVVLAGTGSAVAASIITSKDIKDGTIKLADISKSARKSLAGKVGPQGASGLNGTARAYARVSFSLPVTQQPGFIAGYTKGFSDVTRTSTGRYCLTPAAGLDLSRTPGFRTTDSPNSARP